MDTPSESSEDLALGPGNPRTLALMPGNPIITIKETKNLICVSNYSVFQIESDLFGTGFLCKVPTKYGVELKGFFTNNHVIARHQFSQRVRLIFEFGETVATSVNEMPYAFTSKDLDVTFVQLAPSLIKRFKEKGAKYLEIASASEKFTGRFYIIQYPLSGKVSISAGDVTSSPIDSILLHEASTQEGSSGSPLVDESLKVIAIHRGHMEGILNLATVIKYAADEICQDYKKRH